MNAPDVRAEDHGSFWLLHPMTAAAEEWMDEHLPEDAQRLDNAVAVEHRYVGAILEGMQDDGLVLL